MSLDRGLLYAEACFETVRIVRGEVFRWPAHVARLRRGLAQFDLRCPEELLPLCLHAAADVGDDALVRLTISGGLSERGLLPENKRKPHTHVQAWPYRQSAQAIALRSLRWSPGCLARNAKFTADYAATIRVLHQARQDGLLAQDEQGLFIYNDEIMATETANILIHVNGRWFTPNADAVLPGIVREALLESACIELARCPLDWLAVCDAMAVCNSGCFVRAVASIDGRSLTTSAELFSGLVEPLQGQTGVPDGLCV